MPDSELQDFTPESDEQQPERVRSGAGIGESLRLGSPLRRNASPSLPACSICKDLRIGIPVHFEIQTARLRHSARTCPPCDLLLRAMNSISDRFPPAAAARKLKVAPAGSWSGLKISLDDFKYSSNLDDANAELDWYEVYMSKGNGALDIG